MKKYGLKLIHNDGDYVVLETGTKEYVENMLGWYRRHGKFFNGTFKIYKTN